jgi:hypothetical protein
MKNYFLVFLLLFCRSISGQISFPDSSAVWSISDIIMGDCETYTYSVIGDTLIKSHKYEKIYVSYDTLFNTSNSKYYCSVKDSLHKWYFIFNEDTSNYMLYDFALKAGDSVIISNAFRQSVKVYVQSIDSINLAGMFRKKLSLMSATFMPDTWVEGIGSLNGLFYPELSGVEDVGFTLNCFQQNNKLLFSQNGKCSSTTTDINVKTEFFDIYPNPSIGLFTINNNLTDMYNIVVYNSLGVMVKELNNCHDITNLDLSDYPNGIYVIKVFGTSFYYISELVKD